MLSVVLSQGPRSLTSGSGTAHTRENEAYLLGLLAMIKCSICSYQCDN